MITPILDIEGTGSEFATRLSGYGERRLHVIVLPIEAEANECVDSRPIADVLAEIAS